MDFNSLDAQREAAEAFIASQRHEGWAPLTMDIPLFSGAFCFARLAIAKWFTPTRHAGQNDTATISVKLP